MAQELIVYCDESISKGKYFSDFYGGVLVASADVDEIRQSLLEAKHRHGLHREIKWTRVTSNYLEKYQAMMDAFFAYITNNRLKVRIMFRQTVHEQTHLTEQYHEIGYYFLLYYQFIKHAFGLRHANPQPAPMHVRIFFDELPDSPEKAEIFKNNIYALQSLPPFEKANIKIRRTDIQDVDSKDHPILQCLDVVLGAMAFRLNNLHLEKLPGQKQRGKRTIAKEELCQHIIQHIRKIYPNFNIDNTTEHQGDVANYWKHPYRHWKFTFQEFRGNEDKFE